MNYNRLITPIIAFTICFAAFAQKEESAMYPHAGNDSVARADIAKSSWHNLLHHVSEGWYASTQAARIADVVLSYQMDCGGWGKNVNYNNVEAAGPDFDRSAIGATIDNGATSVELRFLANLYAKQPDPRYRDAFIRGVRYLLDAQYENGGWPQFWPPRKGVAYSRHITFNDNAIINVMYLLSDIAKNNPEVAHLQLPDELRQQARQAFDRGVDCILACQIRIDGRPTVWCAQHDEVTFAPANARAYELISFSGEESATIAYLLLTEIDNPTPEITAAIEGAAAWFEQHAIHGKRFVRYRNEAGEKEAKLIDDPESTIWARFYDIDTGEPFFCDRDGIKRSSIYDLGRERRGGYGWYTTAPSHFLRLYRSQH